MLKILNSLKRFSVATIIVATVLGILFIAFPAQCIEYTALFVGASLILVGVISAIIYFINRDSVLLLILGLITLVSGIIVCVKFRQIISFVVIIFGIFILLSGIVDFATSINSMVMFRKGGVISMVLSIISIVFGIIAITKSSELTDNIVRFIGVALLVYAVVDLVSLIQVKRMTKRVKAAIESQGDIEVEAHEQS